ncbi:putative uncharacterized protein DDB_G0286901 [Saccostrea echinata]|uniref:putative uncharacterized protein DDB_G0286901 n=1 Tax=Saccostrea echinata TaxID=191078 RepID=UPI002A7F28BA|nr:putative uncharacterized protein DDB_G0286901 [Saccostrea echinata]
MGLGACQNSKSGFPGNQTISINSSNGRKENVQNNLNSPQQTFQTADSNQNRNTYNRPQNRQPMNPGTQNWNNGVSSRNWNGGPPIWTTGNLQNGPSGTKVNNVPSSNNKWNNGQQNNNRRFNVNWNNGPPNGNWNSGPPNGNWNGGPPNGNWNGGPPNGNWNGGPPNGNWNGGPPNGNWNGGPPNGNWNNGPSNGKWNGNAPTGNLQSAPTNGNWNNGPLNANTGHPNGNWDNGPLNGSPYGPWSQGPPFTGPGFHLLDPDLPDGLDTMYQRMQAMQAMHAVNQYAGNLGAFDIIPPMAFPHPMQVPIMDHGPPGVGTDPKTGFPMRPHTRAGVWKGIDSPSENSTANITMAFSRRNSAVPKTIQPKLAEFLHHGQIDSVNETNNSSGINGTHFQSKTMNVSQNYPYNPYNYGFNAFGFNPWAQSYQPDIPDHLENKNDRAKAIENKPPYNPPPYNQASWSQMPRQRMNGLTLTNQTGEPATSEIMSQGIQNVQKIQSQMPSKGWLASSPQQQRTNQAWPFQQQRYQPWTPSSIQQSSNLQGTKKPDPDGEKQGGDVEKEVDKDKEESRTKTNIDVIRSVLDEVYRQRNNKDLSLSSIMDAINNRETKIKMQYRYEGNVPPPPWTKQLENIEQQKREPVPTSKPAELVEQEVNKTSIPRTGASFRFSSKYIPQNFATLIKNPRLPSNSNFPSSAQAPQNISNSRWTQTPHKPSKQPSNPTTIANKVQTKEIIQQAIGIVQQSSKSNNKAISDLAHILGDSLTTTTEKVATLNVDTEITIQKGDKVHVINHEQLITVPINRTTPSTPSQNKMGVTMAVMEIMPELTTPQEMVEKIPIPAESTLSPSSTFGIIVGALIGLTVILGPIICILCRVRRRHGEKKRKLSAKQSGYRRGDAEAMETMITCDFGDPLPSSSFGIGAGAKAKVKSFLTKTVSPGKSSTELQTMKPKSQTTTAMIH